MKMYSSFLSMFFTLQPHHFHDKILPEKTFQRSQYTVISLGLDSGSSMTKSRFVRRYEDNRYKDGPNIDQSKEISRNFLQR